MTTAFAHILGAPEQRNGAANYYGSYKRTRPIRPSGLLCSSDRRFANEKIGVYIL